MVDWLYLLALRDLEVAEMRAHRRQTFRGRKKTNIFKKMSGNDIRRKRSEMWNFFTVIDREFAKCDMCKQRLSYKTSVSNLRKHIQNKHPTVALPVPHHENRPVTSTEVQPPEQNVESRDFLQMDLSPSQDREDISHRLGTPHERNVKRSKQVSDPNPGPSSSQTCVANESTELIVVKEEPMSFDIDDMSNYNMTFVDVNQHETILAETFETPGTSRAESLFDDRMSQQSLVNPSGQELETNGTQLQSAQLAEYAFDPNSLTSSSKNISSKRKKSEGNGKREYLTSCEPSKAETEIRLHMVRLEIEQMREEHVTKMANLQRKMDIQLDQMKKEHESNMANLQRKMNIQLDQMKKEHESNMTNFQTKMDIQHEAKMKEHEIKMIELTGNTDQIRLKNEEIKKKMELDGMISELTVKKLTEKINAIIMKREQVSQVHELTVQGLKQKLNNSYLENQILKMKQDALEK